MKINNKRLVKGGALTALLALSATVSAVEKPQTMEDMWKIIQAQQKQIDEMKAGMGAVPNKTATSNVQSPENTVASSNVQNLERKTDILSQEVEKLRTNLAIPEEAQYKSAYGLGPAASKVYQVGKGLSIGGYGEANYQKYVSDQGNNKDNADFERMVLYVGYKFTDNILFNSELEFEHGSTAEGGTVSVEFAALDFFIDPMVNARAGMVLLPMGFLNQIHEPPFYFGNNRPEVERRIIPSTWREIGVGLFGAITPNLTYTGYVVNGLDAQGFNSNGIRDGRQSGSQALAENFGYVARMDYTPDALPGVSVGGSAYVGNSGQDQKYAGQSPNVFTQLYEAHVQWKYRGLEFRTLGSWGHINDASTLSAAKGQTIGSQNYGWYTEVGYDVLPLLFKDTPQYLAPFFRYEQYDTIAKAPSGYKDNQNLDRQIFQVGLQYKPIPNVVIKADYRNFSAEKGSVPDDFNLGFGFIF
jgi:polyhydroxyalkanoate synthesis regulator phasin